MTCVECERLLEHCHGTWVAHLDGGECTDEGCGLPEEAHVLVVDCADAGCCPPPT